MKRIKLIPLIGLGLTLFLSKPHLLYGNTSFGGGSGTESDPYLISTPEHLNQLQLDVNVNGIDTTGKHYRLINDIDLSGYDNDSDEGNGNFTPIGTSENLFKGVFDGRNYKILNITIFLPSQKYVGFFGYSSNSTIRNLELKNLTIQGNQYVGGLIGRQEGGSTNRSCVSGKVSGDIHVGGVIGYQKTEQLKNLVARVK